MIEGKEFRKREISADVSRFLFFSMKRLVITEKLSVAKSIADVIGAEEKKKGYFSGKDYLVGWCMGHLIEAAAPEDYDEKWGKWCYEDLPIIPKQRKYVVKEKTREQYEILCRLMNRPDVEYVINACDAGREGELIFRLVYEMARCQKSVKRLWISSMEAKAVQNGFDNLKPGTEYDCLYDSALCRQRADWLVGINGTRLFTMLYGGRVLKVGRVQTPTLAMLVEREADILNFKKEKYFSVGLLCDGIHASSGRIDSREDAEEMAKKCKDGEILVESIERESKVRAAPKNYDLTTLQRDANRIFGFTAKQTLEYAQSLYEKKLITYPRTDSQYLTEDMEQTTQRVIEAINKSTFIWKEIECKPDIRKIMDSKKVTDHHAIIPTVVIADVDISSLPMAESKILMLIENRLLCAVGEAQKYETVKVKVVCGEYVFEAVEKVVTYNGWKEFDDAFKSSFDNTGNREEKSIGKKLLELSEGQTFGGAYTKVNEHFTAPPKYFTEDTLLSAMERAGSEDMGDDVERKGLGTPATRADVIEKLVKDGYVKREKKKVLPTADGMKLITVVPDVMKSPKLTADWENALTLVAKGEFSAEDFMVDVENMVSELVRTCHRVSDKQKKMFEQEREVFGVCPNCGSRVVNGKYGAYCENKCGMNVSKIMGVSLTDEQVRDLLAGKKILLKGLKGKEGKKYDAFIVTTGTEEYRFTKDGEEKSGMRFKFKMEFQKKKFSDGKKK